VSDQVLSGREVLTVMVRVCWLVRHEVKKEVRMD